MGYGDYLRALLRPLGIYSLQPDSLSGSELDALGLGLDELSRRGVHATFFVIGENVAGNEDLLLRMEREDCHTIPIIAMSANAFDDDLKKSVECGMNGHLAKPVEVDKLYQVLDEVLR